MNFAEKIRQRAITGSGIAPALWDETTVLLTNQKIEAGGEVTHPLYDALGWHFARFGNNANEQAKEVGVGLIDRFGEVWQVIKEDKNDPRGYRYIAPKGIGNRAFFPRLDKGTIAKICERHGVECPDGVDPWDYFYSLRIPLDTTEGGAKGLGALSHGYLVAALYGKDCLKSPDLIRWCEGGRTIRIAMDQDTGFNSKGESKADNTKRSVFWGAKHLQKQGASVEIIEWDPALGKGLDDLLVGGHDIPAPIPMQSQGSLEESLVKDSIVSPWGTRAYDAVIPANEIARFILDNPTDNLFLDGVTGSAKTSAVIEAIGTNPCVLNMVPSRSLKAQNQIRTVWDVEVINSLYKVVRTPEIFFIDEVDQVHKVLSIDKHNETHRYKNASAYKKFVREGRVIAGSATGRREDLELLETIKRQAFKLIKVIPSHGFEKGNVTIHRGTRKDKGSVQTAKNKVLWKMAIELVKGGRVLVAFDHSETSKTYLEILIRSGLKDEEILTITSGTKHSDPRVEAFLSAPDPGAWLATHPEIRLVIYNHSIPSGFSIVDPQGEKLFTEVFGFFSGHTVKPSLITQMLYRYRSECPKVIALPLSGRHDRPVGDRHRNAGGRGKTKALDGIRLNTLERETLIGHHSGIGFLNYIHDEIGAYGNELDYTLGRECAHFPSATIAYLERDGFTVESITHEKEGQSTIDSKVAKMAKAAPIVSARAITESEYRGLKCKPELPKLALYQIEAYEIRQFWGLPWDNPLTEEKVIEEGFGKGRKALKELLRVTILGQAALDDRNVATYLGEGNIYSRDMSNYAASHATWQALGMDEIAAYVSNLPDGYTNDDPVIRAWWDGIIKYQDDLNAQPRLMGLTLPYTRAGNYSQMLSILGRLLRRIGLETGMEYRTINGKQKRVYFVTPESLAPLRGRVLAAIAEGEPILHTPLVKVLLGGVYSTMLTGLNVAIQTEDTENIEYFGRLADIIQGIVGLSPPQVFPIAA